MISRYAPLCLALFLVVGLACQPDSQTEPSPEPVQAAEANSADANVVEIVARGLTFEAPDQIPSGWTTLRLDNQSEMIHFALLQRLPEGVGIAEQQAEVAPIFQEGMNLLNEGQVDEALAAFGNLPEWFGEIVFLGGTGLISAGGSAETTVQIEPGTYLLECYVKTNGIFHSYNPSPDAYGMIHELTVTEESNDAQAPRPTHELTLSSERGLEDAGNMRPGSHTVAVHFEDQQTYTHFLGHDVHLVRLEDDTDMDALATWMDWTQPTGLETPAPAEFLGGVQDMPAGATGYFNVVLTPGRYAWIAEVPDPADKNMFHVFDVPASEPASD